MTSRPGSQPESITATVALSFAGTPVRVDVTVPTQVIELHQLLPSVRSVTEQILGEAVKAEEAQGRAVSCRSGCGACCRQIVPISEVEARMLHRLVEEMPEPRRTQVKERFEQARQALEEGGLLDALRTTEALPDEALVPIALEYFNQHIPCPFLEAESCSIHPDRPVVCREYLVTSPADLCSNPRPESIQRVPLPVRVSSILNRMGQAGRETETGRWVPLVLALEWASSHPDQTPARSGPNWLREFFERLTGKPIPAPGASNAPSHSPQMSRTKGRPKRPPRR